MEYYACFAEAEDLIEIKKIVIPLHNFELNHVHKQKAKQFQCAFTCFC